MGGDNVQSGYFFMLLRDSGCPRDKYGRQSGQNYIRIEIRYNSGKIMQNLFFCIFES